MITLTDTTVEIHSMQSCLNCVRPFDDVLICIKFELIAQTKGSHL